MKKLKKLSEFLFNTNTGYFLNQHSYQYNGQTCKGWVLCKGFRILGIPGFDRIDVFHDLDEARTALDRANSQNK